MVCGIFNLERIYCKRGGALSIEKVRKCKVVETSTSPTCSSSTKCEGKDAVSQLMRTSSTVQESRRHFSSLLHFVDPCVMINHRLFS